MANENEATWREHTRAAGLDYQEDALRLGTNSDWIEIAYIDGEAELRLRVWIYDGLLNQEEQFGFTDFMRRTGITRPRTRIVPG